MKMQALTENTLRVCSSKRCPYLPSACENVDRRSFDTRRLERGLDLEEDLVGVDLNRMSCGQKGDSKGRASCRTEGELSNGSMEWRA